MIGLINRGNLPDSTQSEFENFEARLKEIFLREHNEDGTHVTSITAINYVPVGVINGWPTATAPTGWVLCEGQQLSRLTYKGLFDIISTTYGAGDGSTTFNVPDLRGRFVLGKAAAGTGSSLAGTGGSLDHSHSSGTLAGTTSTDGDHDHTGTTGSESSHTHAQTAHFHAISGVNTAAAGADVTVRASSTQDDIFGDDGTGPGTSHSHTISGDGDHSHTVSLSSGSSGTANPAFIALNYIIFTGVA